MEKLTPWQATRDIRFLGSYDLIKGCNENRQPIYEPQILTIKKINLDEEVLDLQTNKKSKKVVIYFAEKNTKPMILNSTNKKSIAQVTGTIFCELWIDKKIMIAVDYIKAFGSTQPALRIKPLPQRICDVCGKVISEELYQSSKQKYGKALCSKECLEKLGDNK